MEPTAAALPLISGRSVTGLPSARELLRHLSQARDHHMKGLFGRLFEISARVKDDIRGAGQVAKMSRIIEVFATGGPFIAVAMQVNVIRGVNGEGYIIFLGSLLDGGAGGFADANAIYPGQLEGVQANGSGITDAAH